MIVRKHLQITNTMQQLEIVQSKVNPVSQDHQLLNILEKT